MGFRDKVWQKTRDTGKNLATKAKEKTIQEFGKLKRKSIFDDFHLTKGEFVATKDFRQILAFFASTLLFIFLLLSIGELFFSFYAYTYLSSYSHILKEFSIYALIKYMGISFVVTAVFGLFSWWTIDGYRTAEEELQVNKIKRSHIYIKISSYGSFVITIVLIILLARCSNFFYYLYESLKNSMGYLVTDYLKNIETKEEMDRMQWYYDCCGAESYMDWVKIHINSELKDNSSVPFSCCRKDYGSDCQFSSTPKNIYENGCRKQVIQSLYGLKTWIQWYRLFQMFVLFFYTTFLDIIQQSLQSEYDAGATPPVAKFPTFYVVIEVILLMILYFTTFKDY